METEQQLLEAIGSGEREALRRLYERFAGYAVAVGQRYVPDADDVRDLVQDSFVKILTSVHRFSYRGEGSLKAWVGSIVAHHALDYVKAHELLTLTDHIPEAMPDEEEPDVGRVPPEVLNRLIGELPTGYRTVLNLYVFEQRSHKEIAQLLGIKPETSASHHDHPVSLGLTASYPLTNRWSLQTGLVYTRLHADFETVTQQRQFSQEQTLHYLGIPIRAQYLLWGDKRWKLYASSGIQMDWNVSAKLETEGVRQKMKKDHMQWSVDGSLGIEYTPIPLLGIYAEPGFRYYFDNGSKVQNFFKDQSACWTFQLGVRLNLQKR